PGAGLSLRMLAPVGAVALGWSVWAIQSASAEAWAAAVTLPLTAPPAWGLIPGVIVLGLPWSPLAALASFGSVRADWSGAARGWVGDQARIGLVAALSGTLIPGLAPTARVVVLVALAAVTAAALERLWSGTVSTTSRRVLLGLGLAIVGLWTILLIPLASY